MQRNRIILLRWLAVVSLAVFAAWLFHSYWREGIVFLLLRTDAGAAEKLVLLRDYFAAFGYWGPLVYMLVVTVEVVVAPIPGAMLYAPGGAIFGGFVGGLMALIGNVLGAGLSYLIARALGRPFLEKRLRQDGLSKSVRALEERGFWVIFLLRVNPVTSSDLVSYAAGLTRMPLWKVLLGTLFGMAPLCWAQSYLAETLFSRFPMLLYSMILVGVLYILLAVWILRRVLRQPVPAQDQLSDAAADADL